jgi:hypothetical protein
MTRILSKMTQTSCIIVHSIDGLVLPYLVMQICAVRSNNEARVVLVKLTGFQLVKIFRAFHGTRKFITAFVSARHLSLFWASAIQSIPTQPTSWRSILILSSHLRVGLPNGLFPSRFHTKTLYMPLLYTIRATCPSHLCLLDSITWMFCEEYISLSSTLCSFLHPLVTSFFLGLNILPIPYSQTPSVYIPLSM